MPNSGTPPVGGTESAKIVTRMADVLAATSNTLRSIADNERHEAVILFRAMQASQSLDAKLQPLFAAMRDRAQAAAQELEASGSPDPKG